jgi:hypothetical protein
VAGVPAHGNARHPDERIVESCRAGALARRLGSNMKIRTIGRVSAWFAVVLGLLLPALAHNGPPFPIIENQKLGPCIISLWTHPDVGTGTFFVLLDPLPGSKIPDDLKIGIGVQPESGRLPEVVYAATREDNRGQVEYKALAQFDRDEFWRVRLVLQSSQGSGEMLSRVEATPPGFGRWDLLLYLLPFLAVAFLWFRGMTRTRERRKKLQIAC